MKFPPISTRAKLSWGSSKLHNSTSFLESLSWGFTLGKNPHLGIALGLTSSVLNYLKDSDMWSACANWEYSTDYLVCSFIKDLTRKNFSFLLEGQSSSEKTYFWEISPDVWVASRDQWESWWYPNFETAIKAFLSTEKFWRLKESSGSKFPSLYLEPDDSYNTLEEFPLFQKETDKINLYINKGESRCLLFTGPPGTGKTSLITQIAKSLGSYLRVPFPLAKDNFFWDLATIMKFPVVIIDDIDHGNLSSSMLSNLERIRKHTPLILMSSNSTTAIKGAILRPGRIDEVIEVRLPDPELIKKISSHIPIQYQKELGGLYISYVEEINTRCKVEGADNIEAWIVEMHDRVTVVGDGWNQKSQLHDDDEEDFTD